MPALLDLSLAIFVLVGAFFLGSAAYALIKEIKSQGDNKNDQTK